MAVEDVAKLATSRLLKHNFTVQDNGSDRHGAREWSWVRERAVGKGHCYVSLDRFESKPGGKDNELEVWAGADDGERFGRELIQHFAYEEKDEVILDALERAAER